MKPIGKIAKASVTSLHGRTDATMPERQTPSDPPRPAALRRIWERMIAIYGHKWASHMGSSPQDDDGQLTLAGDTWSRGLTQVSESQIAAGLAACINRDDEWPPTLPRFRAMAFGIPSFGAIRRAVVTRDRTPFVLLVWQHLDAYVFFRTDTASADRLLRDAYDIARDHVMRGGELPEPPVAEIEHKEPERNNPVSAEAMAAFAAKLGAA